VRLKIHRGPLNNKNNTKIIPISLISDDPFEKDEFVNWKHAATGLMTNDARNSPGSPYDLFQKKYDVGGLDLILAKQMALKSVFDFDWADPTIDNEGRADKGEAWITKQVEKNLSKIENRYLIQKECEVRNEIAVIRSKQQRMEATKEDEANLSFYQNELAELRNKMSDEREKYKRDNPRTYGIVTCNDRNKRRMLDEEKREIKKYKSEKKQADAKAKGGPSLKPWETNPFIRVPMVPTQLWMTGSTAKEKLALRQAVIDKAKAEKDKKAAAKPTDAGQSNGAAVDAPKKTVESQRADDRAKAFVAAYGDDGSTDAKERPALQAMTTSSVSGNASGSGGQVVLADKRPTEIVMTMGDYLKRRRKLAD